MFDFKETTKADELFEALGYQKDLAKAKHGVLKYQTKKHYVQFYLKKKRYFCTTVFIYMALHKAIDTKLKELKWIGD